jgi:hypothetical protein
MISRKLTLEMHCTKFFQPPSKLHAMKKMILLCCSLLCTLLANSQSHLRWTNTESTPFAQINDLRHMSTDAAGNTYTVDFTQSNLSFYVTYRFFCYNNKGEKQWQYDNDSCFTDCADKYFLGVPAAGNGAIFIGTYDDLSGAFQVRLKHIDRSGKLAWQNNWTSPMRYAVPVSAQLDVHGDLVVAFKGVVRVADQQDFVIAKFDTGTGKAIWHYEMPDGGTPGHTVDEDLNAMSLDEAGNIYACGSAYYSATGAQENILLRLSSSGSPQYKQVLWSGYGATINKMQTDGNGFLYFLGQAAMDTPAIHLEKRRATDGGLVWSRDQLHDSAAVTPADLMLLGDRIFTVYNYRYFIPDTGFGCGSWGKFSYALSSRDTAGTLLWGQENNGELVQLAACGDRYCSLVADDDTSKSYLVLTRSAKDGHAQWSDRMEKDFGNGTIAFDAANNIYLSRSARLGLTTIAQWTHQFTDVPTAIIDPAGKQAAFRVWPNPVQDELFLECSDWKDKGSVRVMDLSGRVLLEQALYSERTTLSLAGLAPGTYLLQVQTGAKQVSCQRVVRL